MRIHAAAGYSKAYPIERYCCDATLLYVEGTNEIQRLIIANQLLD
jgi:alkylation response protein AidB-like acyl-CoA dehydrogenase